MTDLDTFTTSYVSVPSACPGLAEVDIFVRRKGEGEGLLLLHGYPQTGRYVPLTWPLYMTMTRHESNKECNRLSVNYKIADQ
jgi:hypothetical protein